MNELVGRVMDDAAKPQKYIPSEEEIAKQVALMTSRGYLRNEPEAFDKLARYMAVKAAGKARKGVLLWGGNGTGKTMWVSLFGPSMSSSQDIVAAYRKWGMEEMLCWLSPTKEYAEYLNHKGSNVTIDDIGAEPTVCDYGTRLEVVGEAIVDRYCLFQRGKGITYATTNLSPNKIKARYDDRILSRLMELCNFIEFKGKDQRIESDI